MKISFIHLVEEKIKANYRCRINEKWHLFRTVTRISQKGRPSSISEGTGTCMLMSADRLDCMIMLDTKGMKNQSETYM